MASPNSDKTVLISAAKLYSEKLLSAIASGREPCRTKAVRRRRRAAAAADRRRRAGAVFVTCLRHVVHQLYVDRFL